MECKTDMVFGFFLVDLDLIFQWKKRGCYLKLDLGKIFIVPQTGYPLAFKTFLVQ